MSESKPFVEVVGNKVVMLHPKRLMSYGTVVYDWSRTTLKTCRSEPEAILWYNNYILAGERANEGPGKRPA